ncbi:MAG: phosphatase PAP2 family protein [Cytophagaceae bacterium]|nr:phosphatase PAP2 family protein [Cytophagaceae bacterium]
MNNYLLCITLILWSLFSIAQDSIHRAKHTFGYYTHRTLPAAALLGTAALTHWSSGFLSDAAIRSSIQETTPHFHTSADDYLRWAPIPFVYALDIMGVKAKHPWVERSWILLKGEIMMAATVYTLKYTTDVYRPDSSDTRSFPSGHTAQAFLGATFIAFELGSHSIWYPIGAYLFASGIGAMALWNDRHWFSDVAAGAAIGITTMQLAYWTHRYTFKNPLALHPYIHKDWAGLHVRLTF